MRPVWGGRGRIFLIFKYFFQLSNRLQPVWERTCWHVPCFIPHSPGGASLPPSVALQLCPALSWLRRNGIYGSTWKREFPCRPFPPQALRTLFPSFFPIRAGFLPFSPKAGHSPVIAGPRLVLSFSLFSSVFLSSAKCSSALSGQHPSVRPARPVWPVWPVWDDPACSG